MSCLFFHSWENECLHKGKVLYSSPLGREFEVDNYFYRKTCKDCGEVKYFTEDEEGRINNNSAQIEYRLKECGAIK